MTVIASWKHAPAGSSTLERTVDERYRLANVVLLGHPFLYQLARVQHGAVIAPAKGLADFIQRRLGELARQIHRHLPRKGDAGRTPLACHIGHAHVEMFGHAPLNLLDRNGMPSLLLQNIL